MLKKDFFWPVLPYFNNLLSRRLLVKKAQANIKAGENEAPNINLVLSLTLRRLVAVGTGVLHRAAND